MLASGLLKLDNGFFFIRNIGFVIFLIEFSCPKPVIPGLFVLIAKEIKQEYRNTTKNNNTI